MSVTARFHWTQPTESPLKQFRVVLPKNLAQTGSVHRANKRLIEIVHARLALKSKFKPTTLNFFRDAETAFAIECE